MPWKECDLVSRRLEFCQLASLEGSSMMTLCRRFEVSRKTGYKWLHRFRQEGEAGLVDRSRRPQTYRCPTAAEVEEQVLAVRDVHPAWGGRKIHARLKHLGAKHVPAPSTITAILHRHGRIDAAESAQRQPCRRFERAAPNELWQMDFKGEFRMTNGRWCYPLTVLDDRSRFSLVLSACGNQQRQTVRGHLEAAFRLYGLPQEMLMDNGSPWGVPHMRGAHTRLSVWLMELDIAVLHGRPHHPQTQGKEERFHRTLKLEVLQGRQFDNLRQTQREFDPWRSVYNHQRPHEALDMQVPASRYRQSQREYPRRRCPFEYDSTFVVRKVDREGRVVFGGREYYLSQAFQCQRVGVRGTAEDGKWAVYYRTFHIATLDERQGRPRRKRPRGSLASARYARESQRTTPD